MIDQQPRRLRWSVSPADVSVLRWLDEQEAVSQSLRILIRESIQRDGYIDVVNKPVEQLPRRGRPPADLDQEALRGRPPGDVGESRSSQDEVVTRDDELTQPSQEQADPASVPAVPQHAAPHVEPEPESEAAVVAQVSPTTSVPEPSSQRQASIDEIMASTRR